MFKNSYLLFDKDGDGAGGGTAGTQNGGETKLQFTQAELDRQFGERATRAKEAELRRLLEASGAKDEAELKALVEAARAKADAEKTELEKLSGKLKSLLESEATAKAALAEQRAIAEANELRLNVILETTKSGLKFRPEAQGDVWLVIKNDPALLGKIKRKDDGSYDGIAAALKAVADARPHWVEKTPGTPRDARSNSQQKRDAQDVPERVVSLL